LIYGKQCRTNKKVNHFGVVQSPSRASVFL